MLCVECLLGNCLECSVEQESFIQERKEVMMTMAVAWNMKTKMLLEIALIKAWIYELRSDSVLKLLSEGDVITLSSASDSIVLSPQSNQLW